MGELAKLASEKGIDFKSKKEWRDSPTTISYTDFSKLDLNGIEFIGKLQKLGDSSLKINSYKDIFQTETDPMLEINRKIHNFSFDLDADKSKEINLGENECIIGSLTISLSKNAEVKINLGRYKLLDLVIEVNCKEKSNCKLNLTSENSGITYIRLKKTLEKYAKIEIINSHIKDKFVFVYGDSNLLENSDLDSKIFVYSDNGSHYDCVENANLGFNSKAKVTGRGIIDGPSSLIFRGALSLHSDKTNGSFETKTLNLSKEGAFTDSVPILDISAHDVLAKHSSAIEGISKEDIFYLMTRGFSDAEASKVIIDAFLS